MPTRQEGERHKDLAQHGEISMLNCVEVSKQCWKVSQGEIVIGQKQSGELHVPCDSSRVTVQTLSDKSHALDLKEVPDRRLGHAPGQVSSLVNKSVQGSVHGVPCCTYGTKREWFRCFPHMRNSVQGRCVPLQSWRPGTTPEVRSSATGWSAPHLSLTTKNTC